MADLFTRDGKALALIDDDVFDRAGAHVARRSGTHLYGPDGRYVGTIIGDRVVYRSIDDITVHAPFARRRHVGSARADRPRAALRGEEPFGPRATRNVRPVLTRHGS
jgi:hypothetical protein